MGEWNQHKRELAVEISRVYHRLAYFQRILPPDQLAPNKDLFTFHKQEEQALNEFDVKRDYQKKEEYYLELSNSKYKILLMPTSRLEKKLEELEDIMERSGWDS